MVLPADSARFSAGSRIQFYSSFRGAFRAFSLDVVAMSTLRNLGSECYGRHTLYLVPEADGALSGSIGEISPRSCRRRSVGCGDSQRNTIPSQCRSVGLFNVTPQACPIQLRRPTGQTGRNRQFSALSERGSIRLRTQLHARRDVALCTSQRCAMYVTTLRYTPEKPFETLCQRTMQGVNDLSRNRLSLRSGTSLFTQRKLE